MDENVINEPVVEQIELFVDANEIVVVDFGSDIRVVLRRWMDAGMQEDLDREMLRVELQDPANSNGQPAKSTEPVKLEAKIHSGNLEQIRQMILRIEGPGEKIQRAPIGLATVRKFGRPAQARLMDVINEHNLPFAQLRRRQSPEGDLLE